MSTYVDILKRVLVNVTLLPVATVCQLSEAGKHLISV